MSKQQAVLERPIRVIMFGGGPVLEPDVKRFLVRLEAHPEIDLLGAFCQSRGQAWSDVVGDLWRRRRLLAAPLLVIQAASAIRRTVSRSAQEAVVNRQLATIEDRLHFVPDIHDEVVLSKVRVLEPDLGLIYGSPILKSELFEIPAFGTLGIHHGKVPQYRGKKTTFWAMYNGESQAGVTIQKVNAGLDTGQIVNSGSVPATNRAYSTVWNELVELGLDLYIRSILDVKAGAARLHPQLGPKGKLYRDPSFADILRFWWRQAKRRFNRSQVQHE